MSREVEGNSRRRETTVDDGDDDYVHGGEVDHLRDVGDDHSDNGGSIILALNLAPFFIQANSRAFLPSSL
jgi:hypothetical protein